MAGRPFLFAAVLVFLAAGMWGITISPRLRCASLGHPEGTRCAEGRIDLEDHGPFVSVHVDRRLPLRIGIVVVGAAVATGLLIINDRRGAPTDGH